MAVGEDVAPGLIIDEGELVWGCSHDLPVLGVDPRIVLVPSTSHRVHCRVEAGCSGEFGAGKVTERMEVQVVCTVHYAVYRVLYATSVCWQRQN